MPPREDLEAALLQQWSFEELAVYADALIEDGDPRGELIAHDLLPSPAAVELATWQARRRELLARWLGDRLAARIGAISQHGFVHELRDGARSAAVLDSPLGTYVRGYSTWGAERVRDGLDELARRPRPWLTRLSIAAWNEAALPDELCRAVLAAAPRLTTVHTRHRETVRGFERYIDVIELDELTFGAPTGARAGEFSYLYDVISAAPIASHELAALYDGVFAEPVLVVLARAAAAGVIATDGPHLAVTSAAPAKRRGFRGNPWKPWLGDEVASWGDLTPTLGIELGERFVILDPYWYFGSLMHVLEELPLARATQQVLADHLLAITRIYPQPRELGPDAATELAAALTQVIELHAFLERPWREPDLNMPTSWHSSLDFPGGTVEEVAAMLCHTTLSRRERGRLFYPQ